MLSLGSNDRRHHDFIVVGSGAGGGVVAHHLQAQGADVLLVEAGKRFHKNSFPRNEADVSAQLYWGGGLELSRDGSIGFLRAKALGGTTIVNQALLDRFDSLAWDDWKSQSGVSFFSSEQMLPYYEAVESFLSCHTFQEAEFNKSSQLVSQAMQKLGYGWKALRRGQADCGLEKGNDCIACLGGCHRDSKQSSLVTYIRQAEDAGLDILSETQVESVQPTASHVEVNAIHRGERTVMRANRLILCAGALGTTQILMRSGFQQHYPALGQHFSSHPQYMTFGRFDFPVNAHKGYFQNIASNDTRFREKGFKIEVVYAPPVSLAVLFAVSGTEHQRLMQNYTRYSCVEVAIRDDHVGHLSLNRKGSLVIDKKLTDSDRRKIAAGLEVVESIFRTAGALEVVHSPINFGLHLMGGASMGTDASRSVVNPDFQLHDHPRIYVADSSIFPNAPGINPSLTIYALGEKFSRSLVQ